jgi:hypothetical protein
MKNRIAAGVGFASLLICVLVSSCSRRDKRSRAVLPGTWQSTPIVIDGDSKDWPSPYPNYDSKAMVAYATSNDKYNLYITLESGDEMTQMKILKRGLTVSIDTGGKKEPEFSINYPLENDNDPLEFPKKEDMPKGESKTAFMDKQMGSKIKKSVVDANQLSLSGFIMGNGGFMVSQSSASGIKVMVKIDEYNELVWEAVVPFKAIYGVDSLSASYSGKPISVCYAVKGFKFPESKTGGDNNMGNSSAANGGGGGMGGRGMGGGRAGNMGSNKGTSSENPLQQLYDNTKTWKIFGVAYQQ